VLSRGESVALLRRYRPDVEAEETALEALAEELGDLPLAVHGPAPRTWLKKGGQSGLD
jgi:hypothetical protein